jgi:hypothetical protein
MSIALLIGGHLEAVFNNTANIERAKKRMMRYHWLDDTLFSRTWWYLGLQNIEC